MTVTTPTPVGRTNPDAAVRLRLIDGFELVVDGAIVDIPLATQRLVAFLALHPRPVQRNYVAGSLWLDKSENRATSNLRSALWRTHGFGERLIKSNRTQIRLVEDMYVDVAELDATARRLVGGPPDDVVADAVRAPVASRVATRAGRLAVERDPCVPEQCAAELCLRRTALGFGAWLENPDVNERVAAQRVVGAGRRGGGQQQSDGQVLCGSLIDALPLLCDGGPVSHPRPGLPIRRVRGAATPPSGDACGVLAHHVEHEADHRLHRLREPRLRAGRPATAAGASTCGVSRTSRGFVVADRHGSSARPAPPSAAASMSVISRLRSTSVAPARAARATAPPARRRAPRS